jgi:hypothetical protein
VERDKPRVFPRPDILTIRTAKLGGPYFYRPPPHDTGVYLQSDPGRLTVSSSKDVFSVAS